MSDTETVILEMVAPDGFFRYDEMSREAAEEHDLLSEAVSEEKEAEIRDGHDGDGRINRRAYPDRDVPLGEPYEMKKNEETGEWERESIATPGETV